MIFYEGETFTMAIRMVGLDLDGTLFNSRKELTEHTRQVLERAIARGIVIVPATGRPRTGLPGVLAEMDGIRYAIVTNGAAVYDLKENRCIYEKYMDKEASAELLRRTRDLQTVQGAFVGPWGYMEEIDRQRIEQLSLVEEMKNYLRSSRKVVDSLPEFVLRETQGPQKLVMMFLKDQNGQPIDSEEAVRITEEYEQFAFVSGGVGNIEIMDRAVGKGTALLELGRQLGIGQEEIMAVGDSENDLDMIRKAGLGVAMANSEEIVCRHADVLTLSNDEDGAAAAIEQYVL